MPDGPREERMSQLHGRIGGLSKQVHTLESALAAERNRTDCLVAELERSRAFLVAAAINAGGTLRISDEALAHADVRTWKTWHDPSICATVVAVGGPHG